MRCARTPCGAAPCDRTREFTCPAWAACGNRTNPQYGPTWLLLTGAGKQRLSLLPEHGLVIVRFAEMGQAGTGFNDTQFLKLVLGMAEGGTVRGPDAADRN